MCASSISPAPSILIFNSILPSSDCLYFLCLHHQNFWTEWPLFFVLCPFTPDSMVLWVLRFSSPVTSFLLYVRTFVVLMYLAIELMTFCPTLWSLWFDFWSTTLYGVFLSISYPAFSGFLTLFVLPLVGVPSWVIFQILEFNCHVSSDHADVCPCLIVLFETAHCSPIRAS